MLIHRKAEINDVSILHAIRTILDSKTHPQTITLTPEQRFEIQKSRREIDQGLFTEQMEHDKEFDKWLSTR